jgi:hypothetical protein
MKTIKNKKKARIAAVVVLAAALAAAPAIAFAAPGHSGWGWNQSGTASYASEPTEVVTSELTSNSAESLTPDVANAETIVMNADNNNVKISKSGTYIVTGTCANGNLAVKKGTTGVVLILKDLDLTSSVGATVSLNKGTEVKVIIEGNVTLTDAEDIADEETDDFDGAALKAKTGSSVVLTGTGTLTINGTCKNGIKVSDLEDEDIADGYTNASFVIDGKDLTINITAEGDGINSGTDLTIKNGNITDTELESALLSLDNALAAVGDTPSSYSSWYFERFCDGVSVDPQQQAALYREVTKERVITAAQSLTLDSRYYMLCREDNA